VENTKKLNKKEKKEYLKSLNRNNSGSKLKIILGLLIVIILAVAIGGLYFLSGKNVPEKSEIGEKITVDPTNGRMHIDINQKGSGYTSNPPTSGPHYNAPGAGPIACKVYNEEVTDEGVIHNLEHGGVWISYKDKTDTQLKEQLEEIGKQYTKVVVSPRSANDSKIAVAAWGRLLKLESFEPKKNSGLYQIVHQ